MDRRRILVLVALPAMLLYASCGDPPAEEFSSQLLISEQIPLDTIISIDAVEVDYAESLRLLRDPGRYASWTHRATDPFVIQNIVRVLRNASETSSGLKSRDEWLILRFESTNGRLGICTVSSTDYMMCYTEDGEQLSGYPCPNSYDEVKKRLAGCPIP